MPYLTNLFEQKILINVRKLGTKKLSPLFLYVTAVLGYAVITIFVNCVF